MTGSTKTHYTGAELLSMGAATNHDGPVRFVPASQAYFWTPEWQEGEREAEREIREGNFRTFTDPDETLRWLRDEEGE